MKATAHARKLFTRDFRRWRARLLCPCLAAAAMMLAPPAVLAAQDEPPGGAAKRPNLLDIAEAEAQKQSSQVNAKIRSTLLQLGIYTDPSLEFVKQKMNEVASYGSRAVPLLIETMEKPSQERTIVNSGRMAAVILSRIDDERVKPELFRMLTEGNERAKINALNCLGEMGEAVHLAEIEALLASENPELRGQALVCLGLMKSPRTPVLAEPFLKEKNRALILAAIEALTHWGDPAAESLILTAFAESTDLDVIDASLQFLGQFGSAAAVPALITRYEDTALKKKQHWTLIDTATAIGKRSDPETVKTLIEFLKKHLDSTDNRTIKKVAYALNELGDDTGVQVRTSQLDRLISKHSSAEYYFRRGEIYLEFKKYKQAMRDFNEGLRKDRKGGRYGSQVFVSLARCYAAEERYADAERTLRRAELKDTTRLPFEYGEFRAMADDPRYEKVFRPGWK